LILRARNLRDQEVEGSNPFAPTIFFLTFEYVKPYIAAVAEFGTVSLNR